MTGATPPAEHPANPIATSAIPDWVRSSGLTAGAAAAVIFLGLGLALSRVDITLLALPLIVAVTVSWEWRPSRQQPATATLTLDTSDPREVRFTLAITAPEGAEAIALRYRLLDDQPRELVVAGPRPAGLRGSVPVLHSGPQELVRIEYRLFGPDAGMASAAGEPVVASLVIEPEREAIRALPLPRRLQGLTGTHESARLGDGGDFRDVHPFGAGDRLRRIDWKATARRGQSAADLYVRRTAALADATVLLVLDSRDDVGEQIAEWHRNVAAAKGLSALDVAREAASSIAAAYIRTGDRVGFQDLSSRARMIGHAGGERHLWRLLRAIEVTKPSATPFRHQRPPIVPPGALVYLLSSLLDDQPVRLALNWRGPGHRVITVDVLPPARFAGATRYERAAHRVVMMERRDRIRLLQSRGVEILRWPDDDSSLPRHTRLELLSRPAGGRNGGRP